MSLQFTPTVCAAAGKIEKITIILLILKIQSRLRLSMLIPLESPSAVLVTAILSLRPSATVFTLKLDEPTASLMPACAGFLEGFKTWTVEIYV